MKSIMEENRVVENFTILLYSRTYQTLYLEIFNSQNKNLLSKHVIKTTDQVTIELGMPLNGVQMMVKKNEQSLQILNEFKFRFEDFSTNSTVQQMDHYVKIKKIFPQYSLLFQIFYQLRQSFSQSNELEKQKQKQALRVSEQEKKKQHQNQLKDLTKTNILLLGFKVVNSVFRKQTRSKTLFSSKYSSSKNCIRKNKKNQTVFVFDNSYLVKKPYILRPNVGKYTETNSSRCQSKQISVVDQFQKLTDFKDKIQDKNIQEKQLIIRNPKKNLTINCQKSAFVKKRTSQKKITFNENLFQIQHSFEEHQNNFNLAKFKQSTNQKIKQFSIKKITEFHNEKNSKQENINRSFKNFISKDSQESFQNQMQRQSIFSPYVRKVKNDDPVIRKLQKLCQQRSKQKICIKKVSSSKLNIHMTEPSFTKTLLQKNQRLSQTNYYILNKVKNSKKGVFMTKKLYKSRQFFYKNLYQKTMQSIDRQSDLINFVKNQCISTQLFQANNHSNFRFKFGQNLQDLKVTNASAETNFTIQRSKENKLKKIKNPDQFLKKFETDLNTDKKLRS